MYTGSSISLYHILNDYEMLTFQISSFSIFKTSLTNEIRDEYSRSTKLKHAFNK